MTALVLLPPGGEPEAAWRHSPVDDWPEEARALAAELAEHYPAGDLLPVLAGGWIARQRSRNTRRTYARQFKVWENYARSRGAHPLPIRFPLADAFARYLENEPCRSGKPRAETTRANLLSACSSFYAYAVRATDADDEPRQDPFALVLRPLVDPDDSPTKGSTEKETGRLLAAARADSPRAYALLLTIYSVCLRVDSALGARVEHLGWDTGHRVLRVRLKGGKWKNKPVPPATVHAIERYLDGRSEGPLFATRTGRPLDPSYVRELVKRLARKAGLPHADQFHPHTLKHDAVTHALNQPGAQLHHVQDMADHADPRTTRRYDRRRNRLDASPSYGLASRVAELIGEP